MAQQRPKTSRVCELRYRTSTRTILCKPSAGQNYEPNRDKTQCNSTSESSVGPQEAAPQVTRAKRLKVLAPSIPSRLRLVTFPRAR
jgi:hypothetical protein